MQCGSGRIAAEHGATHGTACVQGLETRGGAGPAALLEGLPIAVVHGKHTSQAMGGTANEQVPCTLDSQFVLEAACTRMTPHVPRCTQSLKQHAFKQLPSSAFPYRSSFTTSQMGAVSRA